MKLQEAGVLFVGEYPALSASMARMLKSTGCEIRYAASCEEALAAMQQRRFRVVLSKTKLADGSARELIPSTQTAQGWLFLSFPVEEGCWWIPVMQEGQLCVEAVALRSREFSKALLQIVKSTAAGPQEAARESGGSLAGLQRQAAYAARGY
ncbi:MAG: hypothetical protein WBQ34_12730 [Candidatus Acidiferrales bacterium]